MAFSHTSCSGLALMRTAVGWLVSEAAEASRYLSIVEVAEASDDLLLVQLIRLQLHAPHSLHGVVVLQALLPRQLRPQRRALLQTVQVAFLLEIKPSASHTSTLQETLLRLKSRPEKTFFWSFQSC